MQKNSVNKAIVVGNLGQKPELKYTPSQVAVTNISVATVENFKDAKSGEYTDKTEWHRVTVFGKTAEFVANYLDKGSKVYVEGRLQTRSWDDKDGNKKYTTEIVAHIVTPLGAKPSGGAGSAESKAPVAGGEGVPTPDLDADPLPF